MPYLDFREDYLNHMESGKTQNFMYKMYGELSTTCRKFDYCPLMIARC